MAELRLVIPKKRYQGRTSVVSARLPDDMIEDLDNVAADTGRNRNEIITLCLEFAIEHLERPGKGGRR